MRAYVLYIIKEMLHDLGNRALFVFSIGSREQNGVLLLTPVSDSVFIAFSHGTFLFSPWQL